MFLFSFSSCLGKISQLHVWINIYLIICLFVLLVWMYASGNATKTLNPLKTYFDFVGLYYQLLVLQ